MQDANVLFAADTVMPIPYFVDGDFDAFILSLQRLQDTPYENIIQGHGEVVLRGEVVEKIASDLNYLKILARTVEQALSDEVKNIEDHILIEDCGKSHILLNGAVRQLHRQNVITLVNQYRDKALLQAE